MRNLSLAITGIGALTPVGAGAAALARALDGLDPAPAGAGPLPADDALLVTLPPPWRRAAFAVEPPRASGRRELHAPPRITRLAQAATREAVAQAALPYDGDRVGLAFATGLGPTADATSFVRGYLADGPELASPRLFSHVTPPAVAGQLSIEHQLRGPSATVHHRDGSALMALVLGAGWLTLGRADAVVVVAVEEVTVASLHAHARFGGLTRDVMRPYERLPSGFVLGEAAVALVLERADEARARQAAVRATLIGAAESSDARPRVGWGEAPAPHAVESLRAMARLSERVDWIAGAGNGTALDALELHTLVEAFGPTLPPLSSILGHTGESFSSAALRLLAAVWALEQQRLPGTVGVVDPLPGLAAALVREPRPAAVARVLVPSLCQGGANVVIALARA